MKDHKKKRLKEKKEMKNRVNGDKMKRKCKHLQKINKNSNDIKGGTQTKGKTKG